MRQDSLAPIATILSSILISVFSISCSPSLVTGEKKNDFKSPSQGSSANVSIERVNCVGLDLSSEKLRAGVLRGLIRCLNGNHSIDALEALVMAASDDELNPIVDTLNRRLLMNKVRLRELDDSLEQLNQRNELQPLLKNFGKSLRFASFHQGIAKLLKDLMGPSIPREWLVSLRLLAIELNEGGSGKSFAAARENLLSILEESIRATGLKSYAGLNRSLRAGIGPEKPSLSALTGLAHEFFSSRAAEKKSAYLKPVLEAAADESLFEMLDHFYSDGKSALQQTSNASVLRGQVESLEKLIAYLSNSKQRDLLSKMTKIFEVADVELSCFENAARIPHIGKYVFNELASVDPTDVSEWMVRDHQLKLKAAAGVCVLPRELPALLPALNQFALESPGSAATLARLVRAVKHADRSHSSSKLEDLSLRVLSSKNPVKIDATLAAPLAELSEPTRHAISYLLYFSYGLDRHKISKLAKVLVKPRADLNGKSISDVFEGAYARVRLETAITFVLSAREVIQNDGETLLPAVLASMRRAMVFNSANPLVEMLFEEALSAEQEGPFFEALLAMAAKPEFEKTLLLFAKMSETEDLSELLRGLVHIFRGSTNSNQKRPNILAVAEVAPLKNKRDFERDDERTSFLPIARIPKGKKELSAWNSCGELDLSTGLPVASSEQQVGEWRRFLACANTKGQFDAASEFVDYAASRRFTLNGGMSLIEYLTKIGRDFVEGSKVKTKVYSEIVDLLVDSASFKKMVSAVDSLRFWFAKRYCIEAGSACANERRQTVSQSLLRLIEVLAKKKESAKTLFSLLATAAREGGFARALALVYDASDHPAIVVRDSEKPVFPASFVETLKKMTVEVEGADPSSADALANQKIWRYWTNVTSWEEKNHFRDVTEFKGRLEPMLNQLRKPGVLEAALGFFLRLDQNPYDPEWLQGWFLRLAASVRPIPYFYPGQIPGKDKPTVRLVNLLDLLELIVVDADFTLDEMGQKLGFLFGEKPDTNFAMKYLATLAQSGDDMMPWVRNLIADSNKYYEQVFSSDTVQNPIGKKVADYFDRKLIKPELKRRIFNLKQVSTVVVELIAAEETVRGKRGVLLTRNDLGVLRHLFAAVLEATPYEKRNVYNRDVNSLGFVAEMVKFGLTRNIGVNLWSSSGAEGSGSEPTLIAPIFRILFKVATDSSSSSTGVNEDAVAVLSYLIRQEGKASGSFDEKYPLIGKVVSQIFEVSKNDADAGSAEAQSQGRALSNLKRAFYDAALLLDRMSTYQLKARSLENVLTAALKPWLAEPQGANLISKNLDALFTLAEDTGFAGAAERLYDFSKPKQKSQFGFSTEKAFSSLSEIVYGLADDLSADDAEKSRKLRVLAEAIDSDPEKRSSHFSGVMKNLGKDSEYIRYKSQNEGFAKSIVRWFASENPAAEHGVSFLAERLASGELLSFCEYVDRQPQDSLSNQLQFLGKRETTDALKEGLEQMRRGIEANAVK